MVKEVDSNKLSFGKKMNIKEALTKKNEELQGSLSLLGMNMMTVPQYNNSTRTVMFNGHVKQYKCLCHPDYPKVFMGGETLAGKYSSGYKKLKKTKTVFAKIKKYDLPDEDSNIYQMFLYDKTEDKYSVVERKPVESLQENFGFDYNNNEIDKYSQMDEIPKGTVLIKSSSYDDDMNYCYGKNVKFMYANDPYTSEDAAVVSESFAEMCSTIKVDEVVVGLNSNEIFVNLWGDDKTYQPLPKIGSFVNGIVCAKRKVYNDQVLSDFSNSSLNDINFTGGDDPYYGKGQIIDYTIYVNNPDIPDNTFNAQLLGYINAQTEYWREINKVSKLILDSGSKCTTKIQYLYKRSGEFLDQESKWSLDDSTFGNVVINILIRREQPLKVGQKITGRYGNKSVISKIRPDSEMPYIPEIGETVHLLINNLGVINRTTGFPLHENSIIFICNRFIEQMKKTSSYKEKEKIFFQLLTGINPEESKRIRPQYNSLTSDEKVLFIDDVMENGVYIHQSPMWDENYIFYRIANMYVLYPDILKPYTVTIRKFGRDIEQLNKHYVGEQYIMVLKQDSERGNSARSTGSVNAKGLPERSYKSRSHRDKASSTPIRFGEFENLNIKIGVPSDDMALFYAFYRSSVKGRADLSREIMNPDGEINIDNSYTNRVAEIFAVIFKSLGIELSFENTKDIVDSYDEKSIQLYNFNGEDVLCTEWDLYKMERLKELEDRILAENPVIEEEELKKRIIEEAGKSELPIGPII